MAEVKLSQREDIIRHLMTEGSITAWEAIKEYGCTCLSQRIYDLRKAGWNIESEMVTTKNRYGNTVQFARYHFKTKPADVQPVKSGVPVQTRFERLLHWLRRGK